MGWLHKPRKPSTWRDFSMRLSTNSPSHFSHRQQRVTEQHPLKHSTDSLHWRRRKRALPAPEHPCGFSLCFALPSCHNKSTLRAFITQSLSCDSSPRDTGGESPTSDLLHLTFVFFLFFLIVPGERSSPTTWTKSSSGSLRLASASNRSLSTSPPVNERWSRGSQSFVLPPLNAFRCRTPECKPLNCSPKWPLTMMWKHICRCLKRQQLLKDGIRTTGHGCWLPCWRVKLSVPTSLFPPPLPVSMWRSRRRS